jgi:hypothetical protein
MSSVQHTNKDLSVEKFFRVMTKKRQKREVGDGNKKFNTTEMKTMYNKSNGK